MLTIDLIFGQIRCLLWFTLKHSMLTLNATFIRVVVTTLVDCDITSKYNAHDALLTTKTSTQSVFDVTIASLDVANAYTYMCT